MPRKSRPRALLARAGGPRRRPRRPGQPGHVGGHARALHICIHITHVLHYNIGYIIYIYIYIYVHLHIHRYQIILIWTTWACRRPRPGLTEPYYYLFLTYGLLSLMILSVATTGLIIVLPYIESIHNLMTIWPGTTWATPGALDVHVYICVHARSPSFWAQPLGRFCGDSCRCLRHWSCRGHPTLSNILRF